MSPRAEGLLPAGRRPSDPLLQENLLDLYHTFNRQEWTEDRGSPEGAPTIKNPHNPLKMLMKLFYGGM
jgi:hypothetical protein